MKRKLLLTTFLIISFVVLYSGCKNENNTKQFTNYKDLANDPDLIHKSVKKLTDIMVYDIFSPPVASRVYTYPNVAAYETLINEHPEFESLAGQLNGLEPFPKPEIDAEYCFPLASIHAFVMVSNNLIFSEEKMKAYYDDLIEQFKNGGIPDDVYNRSIDFGTQVAQHVLNWAGQDNYKQTRGFEKYTVTSEPGTWTPTPPDYMAAIEPSWNKIRPFVMDSACQFKPASPVRFSMEAESPFLKDVMEVYETTKNLTEEQKEIASFWDCNPFVMHHTGHVMFATKKISPGGHWMGITSISTKTAKADLIKSMEAYTLVSIALADGFISCWDEKYRSKLVRPETVINTHLDSDWVPLLQTPPFPEYPSGHSVISSSAATVLTNLFGEAFHFVDSTEVEYGLPVRSFNSFFEASQEAAISRLYGGIHYMPAITNGVDQGLKVGQYVVANIQTRKSSYALKDSKAKKELAKVE
jgi:hypothetical protein